MFLNAFNHELLLWCPRYLNKCSEQKATYVCSFLPLSTGRYLHKERKKMEIPHSTVFAICFSFCNKTAPKKVQQGHPCSFQKALVSAFFSTDPNTAAHRLLRELSERFLFLNRSCLGCEAEHQLCTRTSSQHLLLLYQTQLMHYFFYLG